VIRLGVFADSHVSVSRFEPASWHNPYRLRDSASRLERALQHPLLANADVLVGLGDLAHYGDANSLIRVIEIVEARGVPAVLLSGNHDVLEDGVRLEALVAKTAAASIAVPLSATPPLVHAAFGPLDANVVCHEVVGMWPTPDRAFGVVARPLVDARADAHVVLTHFPILSLRRRAAAADLLYSGHLTDLADPTGLDVPPGPAVVLSGHLHIRGVTTRGHVLQIVFAALVEDPYDVALVEIERDAQSMRVSYECASVRPSEAERVPVLDPPTGVWSFDQETWARL
jgi:hypothetical protein